MKMDALALATFAFLAGLTASGLAGTAIELIAGKRLCLGEPFVSEDNVSRSMVLVLLAGPYMVANDAIRASRENRIGAASLAWIFALCAIWLFATGVLILGAVSEFSALSAAAAMYCGMNSA
jgi:hypothetical protein